MVCGKGAPLTATNSEGCLVHTERNRRLRMTTDALAARGSLRLMLSPGNALPGASSLVVVLVILAGASLFASWLADSEPPQASHSTAAWSMAESGESSLPSMTSMPATPENSGSGRPPPSNGADSEEKDGTSDALEVLAIVFWVLLLRDGRLLLAFWDEPAKPSSLYSLALERPG